MTTSIRPRTETLKVPGASLNYEVRGSGPVLLMMPGGPADAGAFRDVAGKLADHYTVVTYDPRGLSHSALEGPLDDKRIVEVFADDVHRLLAAEAKAKAHVFASSGGAVIALELAVRHPEQLSVVVVHEPPSPTLQPDPARERAMMLEVSDTYRTAGVGPAMQKFMAVMRAKSAPPPPSPGGPEEMGQMMRNMDLFLGPYLQALARYEPDYGALNAASCRIVPAVGADSGGELAHEAGLELAKRLGTQAAVFPGGHGGFGSNAPEFAVKLEEVLEGSPGEP